MAEKGIPRQLPLTGVFLTNNFSLPALTIAVPLPLAGGVILQMDHATPARQRVFRYRREDADLDCGVGLWADRHDQAAVQPRLQSLATATDFESGCFRVNPSSTMSISSRLT